MGTNIRIRTLVENTARGQEVLAEHGLSFWIDTGAHRILMDTGQGLPDVLSSNAVKLGVDLRQTNAIVLSHGHYDHTGGLHTVLDQADSPVLYAHPAAFEPKYAPGRKKSVREIGILPIDRSAALTRTGQQVWTVTPTEVLSGFTVTGEVPRITDYEDTGGRFFLDPALSEKDPVLDDQALYFDSHKGTVVLLGCAHSGVVNTLQYIHRLTGERPIHAVIGGMHLGSASETRMRQTISALRKWNIGLLAPAHCTGLAATVALWNAFPNACRPCECGSVFEFAAP
ncbi:MAG: MBL fold metallo-hydrolase [Lentisphaeria bacterium]|nr:MBL fold metallo-hydrolase [Lentisphaeria bacterium]